MARGVSGDAGGCRCLLTGCVTVTVNPYAFLHTLGRKQSVASDRLWPLAALRDWLHTARSGHFIQSVFEPKRPFVAGECPDILGPQKQACGEFHLYKVNAGRVAIFLHVNSLKSESSKKVRTVLAGVQRNDR